MKRYSFLVFLCLQIAANAQTSLGPGDIAIVKYNADNPDALSFVCLTSMDSGTFLYFTDRGWLSTGGFRSGEGTYYWEADQSYACGAVIDLDSIAPMALSSTGDQVLVFQGTLASPSFITAINNEGAAVWQSTASSSNTSALPTGLTNGSSAVAWQETDNLVYIDTTAGTASALKSALFDSSNYSGSNTVRQSWSGSFSVSGCVLPLSWLSIDIEQSEAGVVLEWTTVDEINCSHFQIQSSSSMKGPWVTKAEVSAYNSSGINEYNTILNADGDIYYRLIQHDFDGKKSTSHVLVLDKESNNLFQVEIKDHGLHINHRGAFELFLYKFNGQRVYSYSAMDHLSLDLAMIHREAFIMELRSERGIEHKKMLLAH